MTDNTMDNVDFDGIGIKAWVEEYGWDGGQHDACGQNIVTVDFHQRLCRSTTYYIRSDGNLVCVEGGESVTETVVVHPTCGKRIEGAYADWLTEQASKSVRV